MEPAAPTLNEASSSSLGDEFADVPKPAGSAAPSSTNDTDGIGEVWYRPPIPDPPRSKVSLRLRTKRLNEAAKREEQFPMSPSSDIVSPALERSATGLSVSTTRGRADGQPAVKRKKSIRVLASECKRSFDEALKAWVGPHSSAEPEAQEQRRPFKRLLKRKMTSDSEDSLPTMTCKWVRGEPIENSRRMYVALNIRTGEMMALKQAEIPSIKKKHWSAKQVEDLERLKKETHILAGLEHPNVVQYLGYEETNSIYNLFLRYVSGGSMGTLIRNCGKLKETVVGFFLKQIVDGVDYLHSKGIIHHSLLADNILVEINGAIKISGFGASEKIPESTLNTQQESKTVYRIAPEVTNLQRNGNNFKVDIWSVGCLFLEMMTGLGPWSDLGMIEILSQLSRVESSVTLTHVQFSELANDFRRDCLATEPDERASASELRTHGFLAVPSGWNFEESS
ncbi:kinase-like protein [Marasmius fiardii PR-910]|nr:kinase-like protein [Marasmius fiardii PR-910]